MDLLDRDLPLEPQEEELLQEFQNLMSAVEPRKVLHFKEEINLESWKYKLVVKVLNQQVVRPAGLEDWMLRLWNPSGQWSMKDPHLVRFNDIEKIQRRSPWFYNDGLVQTQGAQRHLLPTEYDFSHGDIWVRFQDLLDEFIELPIFWKLALQICIPYEPAPEVVRSWETFARIKIRIDVTQPLVQHLENSLWGGQRKLVRVTYERLPSFCHFCGLLGHTFKSCLKLSQIRGKIDESLSPQLRQKMEESIKFSFCDWLRASSNQKPTHPYSPGAISIEQDGHPQASDNVKIQERASDSNPAPVRRNLITHLERKPTSEASAPSLAVHHKQSSPYHHSETLVLKQLESGNHQSLPIPGMDAPVIFSKSEGPLTPNCKKSLLESSSEKATLNNSRAGMVPSDECPGSEYNPWYPWFAPNVISAEIGTSNLQPTYSSCPSSPLQPKVQNYLTPSKRSDSSPPPASCPPVKKTKDVLSVHLPVDANFYSPGQSSSVDKNTPPRSTSKKIGTLRQRHKPPKRISSPIQRGPLCSTSSSTSEGSAAPVEKLQGTK